ncbi:MAG TPA: response regulator, partial [Sandaracinaceae bacterium]
MAESLQDLQAVHQGMTTAACDADAALLAQGRAARGLQQKLLELRSLPFGALSGRLQRTVRRTAEELGRDAALEIDGAEVELDRSLLQRLAAPLEHMLRNALAHGIEPPEERTALGKPATGRIAIRVERSGLQIVLTLSDDGRGLDLPRIRQAAVALGLVSPSDTRPDAAIAEVIFAPGLSTAPQLSASSGRGIGLDAASTEIAALGGSIEVASKPGAGTSFRIGLPLSGAAVQVLLVRGGSERYAIPCALVDRIEEPPRPGPGANGSVSGYPLARLSRLLGKHAQPAEPERGERVLLLRRGEERMALQVDAILREQEVVLAPLGPQLARVPGLAGATVLGNEEPLLVIDPLAWRRLARPESEAPETPRSPERGPAHVLVVDDSLTARRATRRLLARAGYRVSTAKDGRDALEQIRRETPSLVVLDLEMPRMDGFELVGALRAEPGTRALPIVIVSSRLADKHRRHALELGADAFFGKPCPEDELLACVAELLGARAAARAA